MLPVNAVGERLEGEPHEPFDGEGLETDASDHGGVKPKPQRGNPAARTLPTYRRAWCAPRQPFTLHRTHGSTGRGWKRQRHDHGGERRTPTGKPSGS